MVSVAIKKAKSDEKLEARVLRDKMLSSVVKNYQNSDIKIADGGKPYLPNQDTCFSVSHSKGIILCGINSSEKAKEQPDCINLYFDSSHTEMGADVEVLGKRDLSHLEKISNKWFSESEKQEILSSKDKEFAILELWTKKEAYLKLLGVGIKDLSLADTKILENDYIFYSERVGICGDEIVLSICVKR